MALTYKFVDQLGEGQKAVLVNEKGLPIIFDDEDNTLEERGVDAIHLVNRVPELNKEQVKKNELIKNYEQKLKPFEGIEDINVWTEEAKKALETVKHFDDKQLMDIKDVETIKQQAKEHLENQIKELRSEYESKLQDFGSKIENKDKTIKKLLIDDQFSSSNFVNNKLAMTTTMAKRYFRDNFTVEWNEETGKPSVIGRYNDGKPVYSKERPGEFPETFDETIALVVEKDPDKKSLLIGSGASGTGSFSSRNGMRDYGIDMASLSPTERLKVMHKVQNK